MNKLFGMIVFLIDNEGYQIPVGNIFFLSGVYAKNHAWGLSKVFLKRFLAVPGLAADTDIDDQESRSSQRNHQFFNEWRPGYSDNRHFSPNLTGKELVVTKKNSASSKYPKIRSFFVFFFICWNCIQII